MKIINVEQGTKDWHDLRRCKVTGTKLADVMGTNLGRVQLISELIAEEATEQSKMTRPTEEMERGIAEEEFAVRAFEKVTGKKVVRGGMWLSDEYDFVAISPDGSIYEGKDVTESLEIKNPDSKNAILYRLMNTVGMQELGLGTWSKPTIKNPDAVPTFTPSSKNPFIGVPEQYKWQCVLQYVVNPKLKKLHFVIHDARFINEEAKINIVTLDRENELLQEAIKEAEEALVKFRVDWLKWKEIVLPTNF